MVKKNGWMPHFDEAHQIHLRYFQGGSPTTLLILERNVHKDTLNKLSKPVLEAWYVLIQNDNQLPF